MSQVGNRGYVKIKESDVLSMLISTALEIFNPMCGAVSLVEIAHHLKTSRYQVKKYMDMLSKKGLVELNCFKLNDEGGIYPPYWGYRLTTLGRDLAEFKIRQKRHSEIMEECLGLID